MSAKAIIVSISSDIGCALAHDLREDGWQVAGTYRRHSDDIARLGHAGARLYECDLSHTSQSESVFAALGSDMDGWDCLVIAPGTQEPVGPFEETRFDDWSASVSVNFIAQLQAVKALLPFRSRDTKLGPCILFFAGGGTNGPTRRYSAYTVSKIALIKMCELLHAEISDARFVIVGPGWVRTKIHQATLDAPEMAGDNYERTRSRFEADNFVPMDKVVRCCRWVISADRDVVGGRNFSAASDAWGDERLSAQLRSDPDMYTLRRSGNNWKAE